MTWLYFNNMIIRKKARMRETKFGSEEVFDLIDWELLSWFDSFLFNNCLLISTKNKMNVKENMRWFESIMVMIKYSYDWILDVFIWTSILNGFLDHTLKWKLISECSSFRSFCCCLFSYFSLLHISFFIRLHIELAI